MLRAIASHIMPIIFLVAGAVLGIAVPRIGIRLGDTIPIWLSIIMFYSGVQIGKLLPVLRSSWCWTVILSLVFMHVFTPAIMFYLGRSLGLSDQAQVGLVLVSAAPAVISAPYLTGLLGGKVDLSFTIMSLSTLLSPLVVPLATLLIIGVSVTMNLPHIARTLVLVVAIPVAIARVIVKVSPRFVVFLNSHENHIVYPAIMMNNWIIIGANSEILTSGPTRDILSLALIAVVLDFIFPLTIFRFSKAYISKQEALALAVTLSIKNGALVGGAVLGVDVALSLPSAVFSLVTVLLFIAIVSQRTIKSQMIAPS